MSETLSSYVENIYKKHNGLCLYKGFPARISNLWGELPDSTILGIYLSNDKIRIGFLNVKDISISTTKKEWWVNKWYEGSNLIWNSSDIHSEEDAYTWRKTHGINRTFVGEPTLIHTQEEVSYEKNPDFTRLINCTFL